MTIRFTYIRLCICALALMGVGHLAAQTTDLKTPLLSADTPATKSPATPATPPISAAANEMPDKIVGNFFAMLERNQIDQAYAYLTNGTEIGKKPEEVQNLKEKTEAATKIFGQIVGYEPVSVKNVGTHLLCASYLSLGKGFPLRWKFYFYRWDKTWRLIDIRVDDRLVDMFDEKAPPAPASAGDGQ